MIICLEKHISYVKRCLDRQNKNGFCVRTCKYLQLSFFAVRLPYPQALLPLRKNHLQSLHFLFEGMDFFLDTSTFSGTRELQPIILFRWTRFSLTPFWGLLPILEGGGLFPQHHILHHPNGNAIFQPHLFPYYSSVTLYRPSILLLLLLPLFSIG